MSKGISRRTIALGLATIGSTSIGLARRCEASPALAPARRVAAFDWALAETLIALKTPPLGVVDAGDWSRFVVAPGLPRQTADLGLQQDVNLELVSALRPDLILASPFLSQFEPQLRRIAPVVNLSVYEDNGEPLAARRAVTRSLADRIGQAAEAERYLAELDTTFDAQRARLALLAPPPVLVVGFVDARHIRVYGRGSLYHNVLLRLGLANGWAREVGSFGYAMAGVEELAATPACYLVSFNPLPPDVRPALAQSTLWSDLPFVRDGRVSFLEPVQPFGGLPAALRFATLLTTAFEGRRS